MPDEHDAVINVDVDKALKAWFDEKTRDAQEFDRLINELAMYAMNRGGIKGTNVIGFFDGQYKVMKPQPHGSKSFDNPREAIEYLFKDL